MEIRVIGLNHKRAPVEVRERMAVPDAKLPEALDGLAMPEAVILSTCNRVEIYATAEDARERAESFLSERHGLEPDSLRPYLYEHRGIDAVRHLFRVAAGLDSLVVGETQILSQVKTAYQTAHSFGRTGRILNSLFQNALRAAKRVHSETGIAEKNVSVSSVAAGLAEKIFQDLAARTTLVIGAGETGELTLQALRDRGVGRVLVANRTLERARAVVEKSGGEAHELSALPELLPRSDIVISCVATEGILLHVPLLREALRARRNAPMFLIDIAVPRNIEPEVNALDNIYLFNIDDLESIVNQNRKERGRELERCEPIIESEAYGFLRQVEHVDVAALVSQLRSHLQAVGDEELERALGRLGELSPKQKEELDHMVHRMVYKVLHSPTTALREEAENGRIENLSHLLKRLFRLT